MRAFKFASEGTTNARVKAVASAPSLLAQKPHYSLTTSVYSPFKLIINEGNEYYDYDPG